MKKALLVFSVLLFAFFTSQAQVQLDATGSGNAFVVTYPAVIVSAPNGGIEFTFKSNQNITGAATLNLNSTGAKPILKNFDKPLEANDIKAGHFVRVIYDESSGGQWQMVSVSANPLPSGVLAGGGVVGGVGFFSNSSTVTTDGSNFFWDNTNKRLGVGTNVPETPLHITSAAGIVRVSGTFSDLANSTFRIGHPSSQLVAIGSNDNHTFQLGGFANTLNTFTPWITMLQTGRVGIGVTTPLNRLDVAGSIAMGAYAGVNTPPTNSLIVSGSIGIGQANPISGLHVTNGNILTNQAYISSTRSVAASTSPFNSGALPISQVRITDNGSGLANGNFTYGTTAIEGQYLWITNFDNESVTFTSAFAPNVIPPFSSRCFVFIGGSQWTMVGAQSDNLGNHIATTQIQATNGTVAAPSYTFNSNPSTGMYLINTNIVGIATGGTNRILYDGFGHSVTPPSANGYTINVGGAAAFGLYGTIDASAADAPVNGLVVSGNVGIGTSTPGQNLVVVGNTSITGNSSITGTSVSTNTRVTALSNAIVSVNGIGQLVAAPASASLSGSGTNGAVNFWTGTNTQSADAANFFWDNTNKWLGIGIGTPWAPLHFANGLANRKIILTSTNNDDHQFYGFGANAGILRYQIDSPPSAHVFYTGTSSTTSTELMRIQGNGNVGIGTSVPTERFVVVGNTSVTGNSTVSGTIVSANARITSLSNGVLSVNGIGNVVTTSITPSQWGNNTANVITFGGITVNNNPAGPSIIVADNQTSNARQMMLNYNVAGNFGEIVVIQQGIGFRSLILGEAAASNIGIGSNLAPLSKLSLTGGMAIGTYATTNAAPANGLIVSGNVGIGTAAPNARLDIAGGALLVSNGFNNNTARPTVGTARIAGEVSAYGTLLAGDDGFMRLSAGGGTTAAEKTYIDISGFSQLSDMNKNIVFGVNGVERMRIINGGNVGIGTNNPLSLLHVFNGSINIESTTNDAFGRSTVFLKSRNNAIVTDGDELGLMQFLGHDGTAGRRAAYLIAHADGTPSSGVTPGRISFFTSQVGGPADQLRMIIKNDGKVGIGTNAPGALLSIANGANDPTTYGRALQITNLSGNRQQMAFIRNTFNAISAGWNGASQQWGFGLSNINDALFVPSFLNIDAFNGNIGIGTVTPSISSLQVERQGSWVEIGGFVYSNGANNNATISAGRANGTQAAPTALLNNDILGYYYFKGHNGSSFAVGAEIRASATENYTATNAGTRIIFATKQNAGGAFNDRMVIDHNGNVGIGTATPNALFDVNGSTAQAIVITATTLTLDNTHSTIIITGGIGLTINIPPASTCARRIYRVINNTAGIHNFSTNYIAFGGVLLTTIAANAPIAIQSDGTNWYRIQ